MSTKKPVRYIQIEPDQRSITEHTEVLTLKRQQELVKGWIELATRSVAGAVSCLYINEEGRLNNMTPFLLITEYGAEHFCGPMTVLGMGDEEGENTGTELTIEQVRQSVSWILPIKKVEENKERTARVYTDTQHFHVCLWDPVRYTWEPTVDMATAEANSDIEVFHLTGAELGLLPLTMTQLFTPGKHLSDYEFKVARQYIERAIELVQQRTKYVIKEEAGITR